MSTLNKPLPPFGKQLLSRIRNGKRPTNGVNVHCGYHAWERCRDFFVAGCNCILFPSDATPNQFDWSVLHGFEITVIHNPQEPGHIERDVLENLCAEIVRAGAKAVGLVDPEYPLQWFIPEIEVAA